MIAKRLWMIWASCLAAIPASAQTGAGSGTPPQPPAHDHTPAQTSGWHLMQDGVVYGLFNRQGGPRGGEELVVPNWWMAMVTRKQGKHQIGLNAMLSFDPWTVGKDGYREIFQAGEVLNGRPLVDRQHPHDLFMQLAASWRMSLTSTTSLTIAGGPVGEPTLGPVAFMHRPSAAGLVLAPLGHHTFDSTHLSFGVVTAAVERGPWTFEGSIFNGREPDDERWDIEVGALDSAAARVWFRPTPELEVQVSSGRLREPEELIGGDAIRTTASIGWFRRSEAGFSAVTFGYGVNASHGERRHGLLGEFTVEHDANSMFGRVDIQQVETDVLLTGDIQTGAHGVEASRTVTAVTLGGARRLLTWRGFEGGAGAALTLYGVPEILKPTHRERPVSFQVFFRLRLPARMGRMWNMRMSSVPRH